MTSHVNATIGARIASLRKTRLLTQDQLATMVGLAHGQIVSSIEHGQRSLKVSELSRFASALCVPFLSLLPVDPLPAEPLVRWRQIRDDHARALDEALFVDRCRRYAFVERITGSTPARALQPIPLDIPKTSYEQASAWAERVRGELGLGELPAPALRDGMESTAGIKVFVTPLKGGSGAATNGEYGMAVLVNKDEPLERQAFSLAHELFHLLTWGSLPATGYPLAPDIERRNEQLADVFASALLLPAEPLLQRLGAQPVVGRRLIELLETTVGMLPETLYAHGFDPDTDVYQAQVLSA